MDGEATDMWNKSAVAYFKSHSAFFSTQYFRAQ